MRGKDTVFKLVFVMEFVFVFCIVPLIFLIYLIAGNFESLILGIVGVIFLPLLILAVSKFEIPPHFWQSFFTVEIFLFVLSVLVLCYLGKEIKKRYCEMNPMERQGIKMPSDPNIYCLLAIFLGAFGAHLFYSNKKSMAVLYLSITVVMLILSITCFGLGLPVLFIMVLLGWADMVVMMLLTSAERSCKIYQR